MEIQILDWINENLHGSTFVNYLFKGITYLGEAGIIWLVLSLVLLCIKKTRKAGLYLLIGYGATVVFGHLILKNIINRPRPFTESSALKDFIESLGLEVSDTSSFPSTHTFISFTSAMIITLLYKGRGAWSYIPAGLIALSRIFLCVHYPTDVLGGAILGTITGLLVVVVMNFLLKKINEYLAKKKSNSQELNVENQNNAEE